MSGCYWFDNNKNIYPISEEEWGKLFRKENRQVRYTYIKKYDLVISTIFLGLDHSSPRWPNIPIVFETMVFCWNENKDLKDLKKLNELIYRYSSWNEAVQGHREVVRLVIKSIREELN